MSTGDGEHLDEALAEARAFVDDDPLAAAVLGWALDAVDELGSRQDGEWELRVARTQLTFARRRGFLVVSRPERMGRLRYPVALSLGVGREIESDRFAAVAHPTRSMWMHDLWFLRDEGTAPLEGGAGEELRGWVVEAWEDAAPGR
ncbi:hypothetical protein [Actinomyces radicidentis]|uniref:hypothetical protein n=1 Tax=Actinomyces radicidentis TaxID=111015 RepID=UPI0026DFBEB5|nr:hypothetical protein [Actinomyces radicidentis]